MKTSSKLLPLLLLAGAAGSFSFGGCASTPTKESTGEYVDDGTITTKVKAALVADDAVKALDIHVNTFKGVVQLSGFIDNSNERSAAVHDAESVAGVKDVKDELTIK